jgi:hypothetical protein
MDRKGNQHEQDDLRISEMILASLEGTIKPEEFEDLQKRIRTEPRVAEMYVDFVLNHAIVVQRKETSGVAEKGTGGSATDWQFWKELAETEKTSPTVEVPSASETETKLQISVRDSRIERATRPGNKFALATALISVAAVVTLIVLVQFYGGISRTAVATVIDSYQAEWADPSADYAVGKRISGGDDFMSLKKGMVKLAFDYGAEVIIEGPASFSFRSAEQMYLTSGKAYTYVPRQATGFIVETPSSKVVDLGTEFGVSVNYRGESLIQMYKGKASVISGRRGQTLSTVLLTAGQAGKVNSETGELAATTFEQNAFVQSFDSRQKVVWRGEKIDLADIVGGGNGMETGQLNAGVNYQGKIEMLDCQTSAEGPKDYIRVPSSSFIDGVFIPNGITRVSSSGQTYPFQQTNGRYWLGALNGAWHKVSMTADVPRHNLRLNGKIYGIAGNPAMYLSANQGITFDLSAIRSYFQVETVRFSTWYGISETYSDYIGAMNKDLYAVSPKASFYVLVDGQVRFEKTDATVSDRGQHIEIPLGPKDRFLTLVTTQGSDGTNTGDWTLFAEPCLYLGR